MLLTERQQQTISSLKEVPDKTIQFQHIYTCFRNCIENISSLNIFENTFLYTGYAGDTTFFLKDEKSVMEFTKPFDIFSIFWT